MYKNGKLSTTSTIDLVICSEDMAEKCDTFETLEISSVLKENANYFHLPIICSFELDYKPRKERISFNKSYLYDKANWQKFENQLDSYMNEIRGDQTIETLNEAICANIKKSADESIPKNSEKLKRNENFPHDIVAVLTSRNYWASRFKRFRDQESATNYLSMEKLANEMITTFRIEKWEKFVKDQGPHPLSTIPFWRRINRLRSNKRKTRVESLIINNVKYETPAEIANLFAENLKEKFSHEENARYDKTWKEEVENFFRSGTCESAFGRGEKLVKEFTIFDLERAIKNMNNKTSTDPIGHSNKLFKKIGPIAKERILTLFNWCLNEGHVPQIWKHSHVSMLVKNGQSPNMLTSYRPISMTPCIARLFERLVLERVQKHLKDNHIIIECQSGFRKARQTKDNLLTVIQTAQEGFNVKEKTTAIFFDVAAAFDKVWHSGLVYKLYLLKIPYYLLRVITNFLCDRTFVIKVDGVFSRVYNIECGVPQGGVLSPTLFQIYINDIPMSNKEGEMVLLFADDIVFLKRFKYILNGKVDANVKNIVQSEIQSFLHSLESWMNKWRLSLAPHKCTQITFSKAKSVSDDRMELNLYGLQIPYELNTKFLGIIFDTRLSFEPHFQNVKKKVGDRINLLKILSYDKTWRLGEKTLIKMYKSLVRSVLDYASVCTGAMKDCNTLETLQNNALRVIFKKTLLDKIPCDELRKKAGVTTVRERHNKLMTDYYERALVTHNPLIKRVFNNYKEFKEREFIDESLADRTVTHDREALIDLIKRHNHISIKKQEIHPTTLCCAKSTVRQMILDNYGIT